MIAIVSDHISSYYKKDTQKPNPTTKSLTDTNFFNTLIERRVILGWVTVMLSLALACDNIVEIILTVGSWFGIIELVTTGWESMQSATITTPLSYADVLLSTIIFTIAFKIVPEIPELVYDLFYHIGTISFYGIMAIAVVEVGTLKLVGWVMQVCRGRLKEIRRGDVETLQ
jgi:hypothetical protein